MNSSEEKIKEKYLEFQILQKQLENVHKHVETLQEQIQELQISVLALGELQKTTAQTEVLAPIANGIFIKAKLADTEKLIINVGSDITVEKTIPEVIQLLEKQKEEVGQAMLEAETIQEQLAQHAMKLYQQVEQHLHHHNHKDQAA